jgi:hypothetical protein
MLRRTMKSNGTNLNIAEETSPGVLPSDDAGTNVWLKMEPNSYSDFGATIDLVARQPISEGRQAEKGTVVGLSAAGGFEHDFTASEPLQRVLQGFMFADFRVKTEAVATATTADGFTVASGGDAFRQGDLVLASGASIAGNNGVKIVCSGSDADNVAVTGLAVDAGETIKLVRVGFSFTSGDLSLDATVGGLPKLVSAAKDLTQLGIIPGETFYLGGDGANDRFTGAYNSGWCRAKSVTANEIVLDKTDMEMVDDAGAGKTIKIYFGRVLKNEIGTDIKPRTYRIERTLGAPDLAEPTQVQAEYLIGSVPNTLAFTMPEKNKITTALTFVAADYETRAHTDGLLSGTREALPKTDVFNSSDDVKRRRMCVYPDVVLPTSAPEPLFALIRSFDFTINNNASADTALGYIGAVEITEGMFTVSGSVNAYFVLVEAMKAIRENADVTFDFALWKANKGFSVDFPLIALGGGRPDIANNQKIRIPLDLQASTGAKYDAALDHTVLMVFFDYLPNFAKRRVD